MKITDVIYEEEDERDYLDYSTGRVYFDLNDGSKAVTHFKANIDRNNCNWQDVIIEQPKVPFFTWGKKRQWYERVHQKLVDMTVDRIYAEYVKEFHNKSDEDKIPPPPPKTGNIVKKGI